MSEPHDGAHHRFWHALREHATHWAIGGVLLAATGFAPEEWFARTVERLHIPENALHLWSAGIDVRIVPIMAGVALIVGDVLRRRARTAPAVVDESAVVLVPTATPASKAEAAPALPLPEKPSIAVLPFANLSGDPEQEYFSDGIAEDIITELSRTRWLFVIARNSSFTYKGHAVDVKQVAQELGVRYVLEGSVRRNSGRVRVSAQLIDAATGSHLWAERYDRELADVFAVQDEITRAVTYAIAPAIAQAEQRRALRKPPESLDAWEAYQRGLWHMGSGGQADLDQARGFFQRAVTADPLFASAHATLALYEIYATMFNDPNEMQAGLEAAKRHASHALAIDPDDSTALGVLAWATMAEGRYSEALELVEHAIAVNPNDSLAYLHKGRTLAWSGHPQAALAPLQNALRLSPRGPMTVHIVTGMALAAYLDHDYATAARTAHSAVRDYPESPLGYRWYAAALAQLGRIEEAREVLQKALRQSAVAFDFFVRSRPPWIGPEDHAHLLDGLRKAGWAG